MTSRYLRGMTITALTRSSIRFFVVAIAACVLTTVTAAGAQAHTSLVSSTPADGSVITAPVAAITLTFAEDLLPSTATLSINDPAGNVVSSQPVQPDGAVVSMPWPANLASGAYEIAYRVVGADGHPLLGAVRFTFEDAAAAVSATPMTTSSAATDSVTPSVTASEAPSPESTTSTGLSTMTLGIILLAVLVVFGFVLSLRRRKRS
jgi:methionine-rich copper-binding protein CopC